MCPRQVLDCTRALNCAMVSAAANLRSDTPNIAERVTAECVHGFATSAPTYLASTVSMRDRAAVSRVPQLEHWQQRAADSHENRPWEGFKSVDTKRPSPQGPISGATNLNLNGLLNHLRQQM